MTNPADIIEYPAQPGEYGRRVLIEALIAAGSPRTNSLTRLYPEQKAAYDKFLRGEGSPADNPDDETRALGHVRGVAADIDATPDNIRRLNAVGLIRPFSWEPWHWTPNHDPRRYPLIRTRPNFNPDTEEDDMAYIANVKNGNFYLVTGTKAHVLGKTSGARESGMPIINYTTDQDVAALRAVVSGIKVHR